MFTSRHQVIKIKWIVCCFGFCILGCTVGPNYRTPEVSIPATFDSNDQTSQIDILPLKQWWASFEDPYLNVLIHEALAKNFDLQVAREKVHEARALYRIEKADLFPKIDVVGRQSRNRISQSLFESPVLGPAYQNFYKVGFDASWEIDFFGKKKRERQAAFYLFESEIDGAYHTQVTILAEIATVFIEMRSIQNHLHLINKTILIRKELLELAKARFESGLETGQFIDEIQIKLYEAQTDLQDILINYQQIINRLSVLTGDQLFNLETQLSAKHPIPQSKKIISEGIPLDLLRQRPDIRYRERQLAAATANIGSAIADLFPRLSLLGAMGFESSKENLFLNAKSLSLSIGPSLKWPILYFGRLRSNIAAKSIKQKQALLEYEKSITIAIEEVKNALISFSKNQERSDLIEKELVCASSIFQLIKDRYIHGIDPFTKLLEAEEIMTQKEIALLNSIQLKSTSLIAFYKSLGGGW